MSVLRQISARFFGGDPVYPRRTAGGIRPPSFKQHSLRSRIMAAPLAQQLNIPLGTDIDAITLTVAAGERVSKYQLVARIDLTEGDSLPVHAPTSGQIAEMVSAPVADHRDRLQFCLQLDCDGLDEAIALTPAEDYTELSSADILDRIAAAGIVGMGGAGFPTAVKLRSAQQHDSTLLLINAAECEPFITADEALIRERAEQLILGADILRLGSCAPRCVIAIEESKPDAIEALRSSLRSLGEAASACEIILLPSKYPAGSEKQLIQCVTGIEVPSGQRPVQLGILVQNTGSAYAAYQAVVEGRPCISRITTLCGETLQTPKNFEVLIGTPVNFLFELCGIEHADKRRSIVGGPLMGRALDSDEAVVCKTTNCLIAAGQNDLDPAAEEQACIRCGFCADVCPAKLLPQQLLALSKTADSNSLLDHGLLDCIECGACDYVCPSHIPLVSTYKDCKESISARREEADRSERWQQRFQYHQYRIKKNKDQSLKRKTEPKQDAANVEQKDPIAASASESEAFSKERASREIAAAVARVKARREEKARQDGSGKESK